MTVSNGPEQIGVYIEEVVTVTSSTLIYTTYPISKNICGEAYTYDPTGNSYLNGGITKLINESDNDTDLYPFIQYVAITGDYQIQIASGHMTTGDNIRVGYYASGTDTYTTGSDITQVTDPTATYANSYTANKELMQSLANMMDIKSPIHLFKLGYRYADKMFWSKFSSDDLSSSFTKEAEYTVDTDTFDYSVDMSKMYPFVVTEVRAICDDTSYKIRPVLSIGTRNTNGSPGYICEGSNDYIDASSTTCIYRGLSGTNHIISIYIGRYVADGIQIWLDSTIASGHTLSVEVAGYYKPLIGSASGMV